MLDLIASCAAGIESLVKKELIDLGYTVESHNGYVKFRGDLIDIIKTNIWLRTADRIKILLREDVITEFAQLYDLINAMSWEDLLPLDAQIIVTGKSKKSTLHSVPDIQSIIKKAIIDRLQNYYHHYSLLPENGAQFKLIFDLTKDKFQLTLDTTGNSLFKRGYRQSKGDAPLKENMAAALILLTNWHPEDMPFVDPMCGSGTIPIEAAMIARKIAPGINRNFTYENWNFMTDEMINEVKDEAFSMADYDNQFMIYGSDINSKMIDIAKNNTRFAGLSNDVKYSIFDVRNFAPKNKNGVVVTNPPYGDRLMDEQSVKQLYSDMGKAFIPLTTWSFYILTSYLNFEKIYGKRCTKKRKLYNGALRTDYYQYWGKPIWH